MFSCETCGIFNSINFEEHREQMFLRLLEMGKGRLFCAKPLNVDDFQTAAPKGKHILGVFEELVIWE